VSLFELPKFRANIEPIIEKHGIELSGLTRSGFARLTLVTTDVREAIEGADLIQIVCPAYGHKILSEACIPHLQEGQTVVFYGKGGASLEFSKILKRSGKAKDILVGETNSLPYACRIVGPGRVHIYDSAKTLMAASFPSKRTQELLEKLKEVYPVAEPAANVLETMLNDINAVVHPPAVLLNAGRIEYSKGEFFLYDEGITQSVAKVIEQVDKERVEILEALELKSTSLYDKLSINSSQHFNSLYEAIRIGLKSHLKIKGPQNLYDRYLTEDIPYGLVTFASFGKLLGVETEVSKSLIALASALHSIDYWETGRTLDKLGLDGFNKQHLLKFVQSCDV